MAKDNLGLLNEISSQLKKLNQQSIRQDLQNKEYQERQLAQAAGGETVGEQGAGIISAAEDLNEEPKLVYLMLRLVKVLLLVVIEPKLPLKKIRKKKKKGSKKKRINHSKRLELLISVLVYRLL